MEGGAPGVASKAAHRRQACYRAAVIRLSNRNKSTRRRAALAALVVAPLLAAPAVANALANGEPVTEGQYAFSTKLTMTDIPRADGTVYNSACSGALVAPQWIITAGHCFHDVNGRRVSGVVPYATTATVGRTDINGTSGYVVDVVEVRQASRGDVALAKLAAPITDIAPLPVSTTAPKTGAILRMTGWGATSSADPTPTTHLQTGQFRITRVSGSSVLVVGYAPAADTSACVYDSGAPYFRENADGGAALVSVESDGPACPHSENETTTRVDRLADWIAQTTA
jgi:secreted trypsin-like serine protease